MSSFTVCPDTLIQKRQDKWFLSNPRTRTHVCLSAEAMAALAALPKECSQEEFAAALENCAGSDATHEYYGEHGLHTDHSGVNGAGEKQVRGDELFTLLRKRWLVLDQNAETYQQYFGPLKSILDRDHIGTFHERVGQYLTVKKRLRDERWRWWHDQKFAADGLSVRPGPYKFMQEAFINKYFEGKDLKGKTILDFACGNGFYSAKLAGWGAAVTGIDTSAELIDIARANHGKNAEFLCITSIEEELEWFEKHAGTFDALFMQDILLLLLNPESGKRSSEIDKLLKAFHTVLKKGGCIYMMEPNPSFWLAGRYGDEERPYAIVTEYRSQLFNVMPTLPVVVAAMAMAGFGLTEYEHPTFEADAKAIASADASCEISQPSNISQQAANKKYADNFPIWDFMRFTAF